MGYYKTTYSSPVGKLTIACDERAVTGLWIEGQKYFQDSVGEDIVDIQNIDCASAGEYVQAASEILLSGISWLDRYFKGERPEIGELSLKPQGSEFRRAVWEILCRIPYGQVITYGEIAEKMALKMGRKSMSAQAVGNAVAHNPISIIIPCHRVVGRDGHLTGYAGGLDKKEQLLRLEGVTKKI